MWEKKLRSPKFILRFVWKAVHLVRLCESVGVCLAGCEVSGRVRIVRDFDPLGSRNVCICMKLRHSSLCTDVVVSSLRVNESAFSMTG